LPLDAFMLVSYKYHDDKTPTKESSDNRKMVHIVSHTSFT